MDDLQQHFDSLLHDIEFSSYDNDKDRLERIRYLIPGISVSESQELLGRFEKYKDRLGSRKGAESFATKGFNKTMNAVSGIANSKPVMNTLKKYTGTQDQRNQSVIEDYKKQQEKEARAQKAQEIKSMKGYRKGCLECKGSRPDNLYEIASGIANNKRSLNNRRN